MHSEAGNQSTSNLNSSSVTSINYQNTEFTGYLLLAPYFQQLNQESNRLSMVNSSNQVGTQIYLNLTEKDLNLSSLTQASNYSPILVSSSNTKDLCRFNPSNSSKNGKNPQTDNNNSLKSRPNCDDWNSKDGINKYIADGDPSNHYSISENTDNDYPQNLVVGDLDKNEHKREMTAAERKISEDIEVIKQIQKRAAYQGYPICQPPSTYKHPTCRHAVLDVHQMDKMIAKELDLALLLSKKCRKNLRSYRLNQQSKQKNRPKTGKKLSIKNRLISITVERIKAAIFNCSQIQHSFPMHKIPDHEANQQSTQNQSLPQPETWNQYQDNTPGQFQQPQLMCQPKPEVIRQPTDSQSVVRKPRRYIARKNPETGMNNTIPSSSSTPVPNHASVLVGNYNSTNHSILKLLHR